MAKEILVSISHSSKTPKFQTTHTACFQRNTGLIQQKFCTATGEEATQMGRNRKEEAGRWQMTCRWLMFCLSKSELGEVLHQRDTNPNEVSCKARGRETSWFKHPCPLGYRALPMLGRPKSWQAVLVWRRLTTLPARQAQCWERRGSFHFC